jgi:hypothetical protein
VTQRDVVILVADGKRLAETWDESAVIVLERARPQLSQLYVDQLVVLIAPEARLVDCNDRADADALDVVDLDGLIPALKDVSRVRARMSRDTRALRTSVLEALGQGRGCGGRAPRRSSATG